MKPGRMGHTPTSLAAGFAITASPGPGGPARQAARPVIPLTARPDNGGAGQMQRHRQVPSRRAAPPGQTAVRRHCRSRGPGLRGGPGPRKRPLPGKRPTCRVCYTPPASAPRPAAMAAYRRGRIADMTTSHAATYLAAVSSLPLAGRRVAPADYALRVDGEPVAAGRRGTAGSGASLRCLPALVVRLRCSGRCRRFVPSAGETLSLAVSCWLEAEPAWTWRQGRGQRASPAGERFGSRLP
jgi:hypothetical protein